uniref:Uncharacterized protein n=1 Tax=Aegilops tauschii subsp. strangulata TaxID=200361 RepID=A0A453RAI8_AEGTS
MVARHPLKLSSSYAMLKGNSSNRGHHGEPLATSYHKRFLGTVDYLWYTPGLECSRVLDTLPVDALRRTRGLPTRIRRWAVIICPLLLNSSSRNRSEMHPSKKMNPTKTNLHEKQAHQNTYISQTVIVRLMQVSYSIGRKGLG